MVAPAIRSGRRCRYGARVPPAAFVSFGHRSFRYFWFGGFLANSARFFQHVALPVVMWDLTQSPGWVGLMGFVQFGPMALTAPAAGVLADHFPRRKYLMVTQSLMGATAVVMAVAWMQGVRSPVAYLVLAGLSGLASGLNLPAWQAFVSELVPKELLLNAVTLNSAQFNGARMVGPMLAGVTVAAAGPATAFWISSAGCLAVLGALVRIESNKSVATAGALNRRLIRNTLAVARYVRDRSGLAVSFVTVALIGSLGLSVQMLTVVFAEDTFERGPGGFGLMLTMAGLGAVLATPVVASLGERVRRSQILAVALALYGAAILGLAAAPDFVSFLAPMTLIGGAHLTSASVLNTTVQIQVDEERRAQVLSLYIMVLMTANPLGQLALGQLIELIGPRLAFGVFGALLLAGASVLHTSGRLRRMDLEVGQYVPAVAPEAHPTTPSPPRRSQQAPR